MASVDMDQEKTAQETGDIGQEAQGGDISSQAPQQQDSQLSTSSAATIGQGGYQSAQTKDTSGQGSAAGARFRNLRKYIDRSKGGMAQRIGQGLEKSQKQVSQQIGQAQQGFQQAQTQEQERLAAGQAYTNPNQLTQQAQQVAAGAQYVGQNDLNEQQQADLKRYQDFQNLRKNEGAADLSLQNKTDIEKGLQDINQRRQNLATEGGRFQTLRDELGRGREYGAGAQKLDQLLLQTKGEELKNLDQFRKTAGVAEAETFGNLTAQQQEAAEKLGLQRDTIAEQIQAALTGESGAITKSKADIEQQIKDRKINELALDNELMDRYRKGLFTEEELATLGIKAGEGLYGVKDLTKYVNRYDPSKITAQSLMSPEDAARFEALEKLADTDYLQLTPEEAGQYAGVSGGMEQLAKDIAHQKEAYEKELGVITPLDKIRQHLQDSGFGLVGGTPIPNGTPEQLKQYEQNKETYLNHLRNTGTYEQDYQAALSGMDYASLTKPAAPTGVWSNDRVPLSKDEIVKAVEGRMTTNAALGFSPEINPFKQTGTYTQDHYANLRNRVSSPDFQKEIDRIKERYQMTDDSMKSSIYNPKEDIDKNY